MSCERCVDGVEPNDESCTGSYYCLCDAGAVLFALELWRDMFPAARQWSPYPIGNGAEGEAEHVAEGIAWIKEEVHRRVLAVMLDPRSGR